MFDAYLVDLLAQKDVQTDRQTDWLTDWQMAICISWAAFTAENVRAINFALTVLYLDDDEADEPLENCILDIVERGKQLRELPRDDDESSRM